MVTQSQSHIKTSERLHGTKQSDISQDEAHAPWGILVAAKLSLLWRILTSRLKLGFWYARMLRLEARSLLHRIRILSYERDRLGVDCGHLFEPEQDGYLVECKETIACSDCIEIVSAKYPWVSASDFLLVREGWDRGIEFAHDNVRNENTGKDRSC